MNEIVLQIIILSAGKGTRMNSYIPKVLCNILTYPMLGHVLLLCKDINNNKNIINVKDININIVINSELNQSLDYKDLIQSYSELPITTILQEEPCGTADAVWQALINKYSYHANDTHKEIKYIRETEYILVLYADTPLISANSIFSMLECALHNNCSAVHLIFETNDPNGYGRIISNIEGEVHKIIEEKECSPQEKSISLCNSGVGLYKKNAIYQFLKTFNTEEVKISKLNSKSELYLTDFPQYAHSHDLKCLYIQGAEEECLGANTTQELNRLEEIAQKKQRAQLINQGVIMIAPETNFFSYDTQIDRGTTIYPHTVFGKGVKIEEGSTIFSFSHLEHSKIGKCCRVGPFARLRNKVIVGDRCKIGNFVEIKNSTIKDNINAAHLAYIGDASIGENTNIGAGTIFCNYNGKTKNRTNIGRNCFIGSNSSLIAPINMGPYSTIGAGSTIVHDIPTNHLAIARAMQVNKKYTKHSTNNPNTIQHSITENTTTSTNYIPFYKMHGLGNDFVIIEGARILHKELIIKICDRNRGVGCDQLIIFENLQEQQSNQDIPLISMMIYNKDGSAAAMCGNGARCLVFLAKLLNILNINSPYIRIRTIDKIITGKIINTQQTTALISLSLSNYKLEKMITNNTELDYAYAVNIGNDHAIIIIKEEITQEKLINAALAVEKSGYFQEGANISLVSVLNQNIITIATYERGVGPTLACGSAACAAQIVCYNLELTNAQTSVLMAGGKIDIKVESDKNITMIGEASLSYRGEFYYCSSYQITDPIFTIKPLIFNYPTNINSIYTHMLYKNNHENIYLQN